MRSAGQQSGRRGLVLASVLSVSLGQLLSNRGDTTEAKAAWQRVIDSQDAECAGAAFGHLVNLLRRDGSTGELRAASAA